MFGSNASTLLRGGSETRRAACCLGLSALLALGLLRGTASAQLPCGYVVSDIIQAPAGPFGLASPTQATAISPNGRYVVGFFNPGGIGFDRAFAFDTQTHQFLVIPLPAGGYQSYGNDVNDAGVAVGSYWRSGGVAPQRGYLFSLPTNRYLAELMPYPGASWCVATGINASNQVCGYRSIGSKGDPVNPMTAFIWSATGEFVDLGLINGFSTFASAISDRGLTTGTMGVRAVNHPYIWLGDQVTDLGTLAGFETVSMAISIESVVVGWAAIGQGPGPEVRGFISDERGMRSVGVLAGFDGSYLLDINGERVGVGVCSQIATSQTAPIVWAGEQLVDLRSRTTFPGVFHGASCAGISDNGALAINGSNAGGQVVVAVLAPQPMPGDANGDCAVNLADLVMVILDWGQTGSPADVDHNGIVNVNDLLEVINNWTRSAEGRP